MSKLPPFSFAQRGYSIIRPQPKPSPDAKELEGADTATLAALAELKSLIEAKGDGVNIANGIGKEFNGVVIAELLDTVVFWDDRNRRLLWLPREQARMRVWPSYLVDRMLGRGIPELESGSEWRVSRYNGILFFECQHAPRLLKSISPIAQRFAERYNAETTAPAPKLKKTKRSEDDEGNIAHAMRPHIGEFTP